MNYDDKYWNALFKTLGTIAITVAIFIAGGCLAVTGLVKFCLWLSR